MTCDDCWATGPQKETKKQAAEAWNRRTEQPAPYRGRRIYIPDEHREKVAELKAPDKEKGNPSYYRLWKFIGEIISETRNGQWALHTGSPTRYFVEEYL
jgi:hypothetical protein